MKKWKKRALVPGAGSVVHFYGPQSFENSYGSEVWSFKKIVVYLIMKNTRFYASKVSVK
jgi:hypothetical protein